MIGPVRRRHTTGLTIRPVCLGRPSGPTIGPLCLGAQARGSVITPVRPERWTDWSDHQTKCPGASKWSDHWTGCVAAKKWSDHWTTPAGTYTHVCLARRSSRGTHFLRDAPAAVRRARTGATAVERGDGCGPMPWADAMGQCFDVRRRSSRQMVDVAR